MVGSKHSYIFSALNHCVTVYITTSLLNVVATNKEKTSLTLHYCSSAESLSCSQRIHHSSVDEEQEVSVCRYTFYNYVFLHKARCQVSSDPVDLLADLLESHLAATD